LTFLDLQPKANWILTDARYSGEGNDFRELPQGEQMFAGVRFNVGRAAIQLGSPRVPIAPQAVTGIPVNGGVTRLYMLHGTQCGDERFGVSDGMTIGQYTVHYEDGNEQEIPIVCGKDVRDWWDIVPGGVTRGRVAWTGGNAKTRQSKNALRLYLCVWENPHPGKKAVSIDFVSKNTPAAPFCVAVTAEAPAAAQSEK
jgi:hypothetical protein